MGSRSTAAAALTIALLAWAAAAAASPLGGLPDPCAVVSTAAVDAALGTSAGNQEFGTPGSTTAHGVTAQTCTWTYGNAELVLTVAPKAYAKVGPRPPAGTKTHAAAGLPIGARVLVNTRPGSAFTAVVFTKGSRFGAIRGNSFVPAARVLKLARRLYAKR